jgi:hypothetical protein
MANRRNPNPKPQGKGSDFFMFLKKTAVLSFQGALGVGEGELCVDICGGFCCFVENSPLLSQKLPFRKTFPHLLDNDFSV